MLLKKSKKVFIHIDCDSFFAACEILKNPSLKWKYVCVWDEIIVASTYNCKALGIKTWTPIWEAKKILWKYWVFLPWDHAYYEQISRELFSFLKDRVIHIEIFSIDEAFCEITWLSELYKMSLEKFLKNLQNEILREIWIPVSIWCAETRIKAKIFSKINKPFGIYIWFDEKKEKNLFKNLSIKKIPFIWKNYEKRFLRNSTIYDFLQLWFWHLKSIIGKNACDLWLELMWVNAFVVNKSSEMKSISRSRSFNKNINSDKDFLFKEAKKHFERVFENIIEKNLEIKEIALLLRTKEFETLIFNHIFPEYTNNRTILFTHLKYLFENNFKSDVLYRSVWVIFYNFRSFLPMQKSLFDLNLRSKENNYKLYKTIEFINNKYWERKVCFGSTLSWIKFIKEEKLWIRLKDNNFKKPYFQDVKKD